MPSARETAINGLYTVLQTISGPTVKRNAVLPTTIPSGGFINVLDAEDKNEGQEFETTISPLMYHYQWQTEIEVAVQHHDQSTRDTAFDNLLTSIGAKINVDKTLGGAVEHCEILPPMIGNLAVEGAETIKGGVIPVILFFSTETPI